VTRHNVTLSFGDGLSYWQIIGLPSGVTDSFSKTSPSSCPPLDNLVVALFVSVWLMARQDCVFIDTLKSYSVGVTGSWQNITQKLSSWQIIGLPSGVMDSFSKSSPFSCPPLDNLVVALFVPVWLMARQDCVFIDILNSCLPSFSIAVSKTSFLTFHTLTINNPLSVTVVSEKRHSWTYR